MTSPAARLGQPLVFLLVVVGSAASARADFHQPGTQPRTYPAPAASGENQLPLTPLVGGSAGGLQLERAAYCQRCHLATNPPASDSSPAYHWRGTMMANAARDPLFWAALAIANQDAPGIGGDYCLRCHSPAGFLAGHTMPNPPPEVGGVAVAADVVHNPQRYPCNSHEPGSPTLCRCLNPNGCAATPTDRDYCKETPERVANGYCVVAFDDRAAAQASFAGHPADVQAAHDEPYDQRWLDSGGQVLDPDDDTEGVQCALCHRIDPAGNGTRRFGGSYLLSTAAAQPVDSDWLTPRSVRYGPYASALTDCANPDDPASCSATAHPHPAAASALHGDSALCGLCHDVTNPVLHRLSTGGQDLGFNMPIERTYSEWAASDFATGRAQAKSCQGCHMPAASAAGPVCLSLTQSPLNRPSPRQHVLTGGNWWMPTVFRDVLPPSGDGGGDPPWFFALVSSLGRWSEYDLVQSEAAATLRAAATLTPVGTLPVARAGATFALTVRVTNLTGHKLPTGYPEGRRMWLEVSARVPSQSESPFFESGAWDPATGVLTRDAQLKIYEVQLGVANQAAEDYPRAFHFATNQIVWKDNRIPPAGLDTTAANYAEMAPVPADAYPAIDGKLPSWDDTRYQIAVPATATGDVEVTVTLVYQTTSKDYVDFLAAANTTNGRGADLQRIWRNHERAPLVVMAQQTFAIANVGPAPAMDSGVLGDDLGAEQEDAGVPGEEDAAVTEPGDGAAADDLAAAALPRAGCSCDLGARATPASALGLLVVAAALLRPRRRRYDP